MLTQIQNYLLKEIEIAWKSLTSTLPWGVWVREYREIENLSGPNISMIPKNVWFLDKMGFQQKSLMIFRDFWSFTRNNFGVKGVLTSLRLFLVEVMN